MKRSTRRAWEGLSMFALILFSILMMFIVGVFAVLFSIGYSIVMIGIVIANVVLAQRYPRFYRWLAKAMWLNIPRF